MAGEDLRFNPFVSYAKDYVPEVKSTVTPPDVDVDRYREYMLSQADFKPRSEMAEPKISSGDE